MPKPAPKKVAKFKPGVNRRLTKLQASKRQGASRVGAPKRAAPAPAPPTIIKKDRKKAVPKKNAKTVPQKIARQNLIHGPAIARMDLKFPPAPKAQLSTRPYLKRNTRKGAKGALFT